MATSAAVLDVPASPAVRPAARGFAHYAWWTLGATLFVILWGAFVRATGSGAGCGSHWPLCNGEVVPRSPTAETLVEFGHRLTSGAALLLVIGLVVGAWRRFPRGDLVRSAAAWTAVFMVLEALIGAGLVLLELVAGDTSTARAVWMAGHLMNTFLLVATMALTAYWAGRAARPRGAMPLGARIALGAALGGVLVLGISGAVTALGDTLFPVATRAEGAALTFSPTAHLFVRLRIWHPTLAMLVGALVFVASLVTLRSVPGGGVARLAGAAVGLYALQLVIGLANVWLLAPIPLQLLHLLLADLLWIVLVLLTASAAAAPASS
ncbi:MAG: COX15/CtaA family protein [bacterium]|nr:COX15/CtaA family protein [bacterium]